jgi:hypothetical protein
MWWILARIAGWDGQTGTQVPVTRIEVSSRDGITEVGTGDTLRFFAEVFPDTASIKEVTWSVLNDTGTASIDQLGLLTAGDSGRMTVVASALDASGVSDSLAIYIYTPIIPVNEIIIRSEGGVSSVESGLTLQFSASILPEDASNKNLQWSINAISGTASIDPLGLLTAGDPGEVEVLASAMDGSGVSGSYLLTILPPFIEVESIDVYSEGNVSVVKEGDMLQLFATVSPSNASNTDVYWHVTSSGEDAVGSITAEGMFIALREGQVDALAIAQDSSGVYGTLSLTVQALGTRVEEKSPRKEIILYPNPGEGLFFLNLGDMDPMQVRVIDMRGTIVLEHVPEPGVQIIELDVRQLSLGIYYIQVFSERDPIVKPVIINR